MEYIMSNSSAYQKPFSSIEMVMLTPQTAMGLLDLSTQAEFRNRNTHQTRIDLLANEISNGNWMDSNDAICTDEEGVLINGYHRCKAVIQANEGIWVTMKRGMSRDAFHAMDTGKKRSVGDVLKTKGVKNSTTVARACRLLYLYEKYGIQTFGEVFDPLVSNKDVLKVFDDNPNMALSAKSIYKRQRLIRLMPPGFLAFSYYILSQKHFEYDVNQFFDGADSGDNLPGNSPVKLLNKKLVDNAIGMGGYKLNKPSKYGIFTKAWNYYLEGKTLQVLRFSENSKETIQDFK